MLEILSKLGDKYRKEKFSYAAKEIRNTPPINFELNKDIVIVSQVYHGAVDMTLLALKSFLKQFGQGYVELLDDGSLTQDDYALFETHIPHLHITHIRDVNIGQCPSGGCWERLIHILELSQNAYVIQLDTDTLTTDSVEEVLNYVTNNQAFTIGGKNWAKPVEVGSLEPALREIKGQHVQVLAERELHKIKSINVIQYCRGCAAFTGFPKGKLSFSMLESFSIEMEKILGSDKWKEWGSEQFASNVMVSMCENPELLIWPKYQNYRFPVMQNIKNTDDFNGKVSLFHFIGTNRFVDNTYRNLVKKILEQT